jgi:spermidine synthase
VLSRHAILLGLFIVSAASLLFEILLTKFFGSKLEHHFTFAIISTAMLGFGAAGVFVHLRPKRFPTERGPEPAVLSRYAFAFALSAMLVVPAFCFAPLDPMMPGWRGTTALPLYFAAFAVPFFFVGVCVSYTLVAARQGPGVIYFWDLLGAGLGAAVAAEAIEMLGGYGAVVLVGLLGVAAAGIYDWKTPRPRIKSWLWRLPLAVGLAAGVLAYPSVGRSVYGHDIFSAKYGFLRKTLLVDFGGIEMSFWNAIARIDVSKTANTKARAYRTGIPHRFDTTDIHGRFILVDGGACTRQFALDGPPPTQAFLKHSLWAAPYVGRGPDEPFERALVIGAGGGVDLLVSKAFETKRIDAIELNPDTYRLLLGRTEDPLRDRYVPWLGSDERSEVRLFNTEARHFCHTRSEREIYDVIEASGVDTLTAIQTAANALAENFLYTEDALADYYRLLKPGGILSTSHGYMLPGSLTLRKFATYLSFLEKQGVAEPGRSVVFVFDGYWENGLLKKGPFTRDEIDRMETWAAANDHQFIYHPFQPEDSPLVRPMGDVFAQLDDDTYDRVAKFFAPFVDPTRAEVSAADLPFHALAHAADAAERERILAGLRWDLRPTTDDRPYFYFVSPNHASWLSALDGTFLYPQPAVRWMFLAALVGALLLMLAPALGRRRREATDEERAVRRSVRLAIPFFALSGLAFMLIENAAFLNLTLFVGGPLYSLAIVLPSVLIGYAIGSLLTDRYLVAAKRSLWWVLALFVVGMVLYALMARFGLSLLIGKSWSLRAAVAVLSTLPLGALLGIPVPWTMHALKATDSRSLAWMWAVSSAFNVIGSMSFVPICYALGRNQTLILATVVYVAAIAWAGFVRARTIPSRAS